MLETPDPHHIPGYTGHIPQYIFRVGDTFGSVTHKLLLDPSVQRGEKLVLADRTLTDFEAQKPAITDVDLVNSRFKTRDAVFKHPVLPGYEGRVPRMNNQMGQRFSVGAVEAVSEFEQEQMKNRQALNQLEREVAILNDKIDPTAEDLANIKTEFKLPLLEVRPEACGILRSLKVDEPQDMPQPSQQSPYFMEVTDKDKYFIPGFDGHVPFGQSKYGQGFGPFTKSALSDFTSNYRRYKSAEWVPANAVRPQPPLIMSPVEIYPTSTGMIPNYSGHVPGHMFRSGKTFGSETRDAKSVLMNR